MRNGVDVQSSLAEKDTGIKRGHDAGKDNFLFTDIYRTVAHNLLV